MRHVFFLFTTILFSMLCINIRAQGQINVAADLAHSGKYKDAIAAYNAVLAKDPSDIPALLGRGATYSWDHQFGSAKLDFYSVLQKDPGNVEAKQGLAFLYLWNDETKKAILLFNELIATQPSNKAFLIGRGQAQMREGMLKEARRSFEMASKLDPNDSEPKELVAAVRTQPAALDLDILAGVTTSTGESKTALRFLQLSSQVTKKLQLSAKYDNTLSLDNLSLITAKTAVPYYSGSVYYSWNRQTATKFEGGYRSFSETKSNPASGESQFSVEQVIFLKRGSTIKLGGAVMKPNIGNGAYLLLAGYHQPFSKRLTAGVNYFYSRRKGFDTQENRILVDADLRVKQSLLLNAGFYYGKSNSDLPIFAGNTFGGFLKGYLPISNSIALQAGIAAENNFIQNLVSLNAGIRFRLEK